MKKQLLITLLTALTGLACLGLPESSFALGNPEATSSSQPIITPSTDKGTADAVTPVTTTAESGLPWFTGPLLAGAGNTIPQHHINIEPYIFYTTAYGRFNSDSQGQEFSKNAYTLSPTMVISYGLLSFMDIQGVIPYDYNQTDGKSHSDVGDSTLTLGFQLLRAVPNTWWHPSLRATVGETFPTGKYQNLDPNKEGTDATGSGVYQTNLGLNFQHLWNVGTEKYFRDRLAFGYALPASTNVSGVNSFGGSTQTNGKEKIGDQFSADLGMEYTLTQNWVPALDVLYTTSAESTFNGATGTNVDGLPAISNGSSGSGLSLAPAMEYNFNANWGIIGGVWFSVAGRNSTQFTSAVVAVNYFH